MKKSTVAPRSQLAPDAAAPATAAAAAKRAGHGQSVHSSVAVQPQPPTPGQDAEKRASKQAAFAAPGSSRPKAKPKKLVVKRRGSGESASSLAEPEAPPNGGDRPRAAEADGAPHRGARGSAESGWEARAQPGQASKPAGPGWPVGIPAKPEQALGGLAEASPGEAGARRNAGPAEAASGRAEPAKLGHPRRSAGAGAGAAEAASGPAELRGARRDASVSGTSASSEPRGETSPAKPDAVKRFWGDEDLRMRKLIWGGRFGFEQGRCCSSFSLSNLSQAGVQAEETAARTKKWLEDRLRASRGSVAVLLPGKEGPTALVAAKEKKRTYRALRERAVGETSLWEKPRRLWLVELESPLRGEQPHDQIRWLRQVIEDATHGVREKGEEGPWLWPLHDNSVSVAVMISDFLLRDKNIAWWRHILWALRLVYLPGGSRQEVLLRRHYGRETSYVFSWANLYIHSMWYLVISILVLQACTSASMGDSGSTTAIWWNVLQLLTVIWSISLTEIGASERLVLQLGGAGRARARNIAARTSANLAQPAQSRVSGFKVQDLRRDQEEAIRREQHRLKSCRLRSQVTVAGDDMLPALTGGEADAGTTPVAVDASPAAVVAPGRKRWHRALLKIRLGVFHKVLENQKNWHYKEMTPAQARRRRILSNVVTYLAISIFSAVCMLVLAAFTQLNAYIIYVWGECMYPEVRARAAAQNNPCRDPQFVHGFVGWLAEVGSDVALAILFDVALGEGAKALAEVLAGLQNYKYYYDFRYSVLMMSLLVEVLSKVGMFALMAFVFLPRWVPDANPNNFNEHDQCKDLLDYRLCKAVNVCKDCCSHSLLCIARRLEFDDRRVVFERSVKGPFMVAPWVRIALTVAVPYIAGLLEEVATEDARDVVVTAARNAATAATDAVGDAVAGATEAMGQVAAAATDAAQDAIDAAQDAVDAAADAAGDVLDAGKQALDTVQDKAAQALPAPAVASASSCRARCGRGCARCLRCVAAVVSRILSLIFHKDGDSVGCFGFVRSGWPFGPLHELPGTAPHHAERGLATAEKRDEDEGEAAVLLRSALDQVARKKFEAVDELLELKMNFLFVSFFAPVMPLGLLTTLAARIVEVRFKATKLLYVRRRAWPGEADVLHETHRRYCQFVVFLAAFWHTGLVVVSYNRWLYVWGPRHTTAMWLAFGAITAAGIFLTTAIFERVVGCIRRSRRCARLADHLSSLAASWARRLPSDLPPCPRRCRRCRRATAVAKKTDDAEVREYHPTPPGSPASKLGAVVPRLSGGSPRSQSKEKEPPA